MARKGALLAFRIIAGLFLKRRLFSVTKSDRQNRLSVLVRVERGFFVPPNLRTQNVILIRLCKRIDQVGGNC